MSILRPLLFSLFLLPATATATEPCHAGDTIPNIGLQHIASGLVRPVAITHANDGSGRIFVLEQAGLVRVIQDGALVDTPLLDLRQQISSGGERGLLGIAFHPRFGENGRLYLNYTSNRPRLTTVIAEFRMDEDGRVKSDSERVLLTIAQPWNNHNGGQLAFGPDGYLYIAVGDGGSANDPHNNGQHLNTLLGSILRLDVDQSDAERHYAIPGDNPFVGRPDARAEIWAYGLRNPWRFSFDRATGLLYAADVGQNEVEEVNIIERGGNYGWRIMEGPQCTPGVNRDCDPAGLRLPIHSYRHDRGRSITGGYVYRGSAIAGLCGTYLYGDFVSGAVWGLRYRGSKVITIMEQSLLDPASNERALNISSFGEDESGELYIADYQSGTIYKIVAKPAPLP